MIDKSTGANPEINEDAARAFVRFVWEFVWTGLPAECFTFVECEGDGCWMCTDAGRGEGRG